MSTLDELVRPLPADEFLQTIFGRVTATFRPEHSLQAREEWQGDGWRSLATLRHVDVATRDATDQHEQTRIGADDIGRALGIGGTVCADITLHPPVGDWLRAISRALGVGEGGFAKLYVSPAGSGFPMHMDPHHVFVLQCRGTKRWRFGKRSALPNASENGKVDAQGKAVFSGRLDGLPLRGDDGGLSSPKDSDLDEVLLGPGDALYLPPGTWHSARAEDESVALSLSPPRIHGFDLISAYLDSRSLVHSAWREDLALGKTPVVGQTLPSVAESLRRTAREMSDALLGLDFDLLARQWIARAAARPPEASSSVDITKATWLTRSGPFSYLEVGGPDDRSFVFYAGTEELSLPIEARPFIERVAQSNPFEARDALKWDPKLRWRDARQLLDQLVRAGLLQVLEPNDSGRR